VEIVPIAEESLGVRSMALFVRTRDTAILFDAGVSLSPRRFGLPPHPLELRRVQELRAKLLEYAAAADVVTVSHYHRDHFTPWYRSVYMATDDHTYVEVYKGKLVLAKSPQGINWSQRRRHYGFKKAVGKVAEIEYVDGKSYRFGRTTLTASPPLPHGPEGARTGFVVAFVVEDGEERLLYMPDVQGPANDAALGFALNAAPTIAVVGGPPIYLNNVEWATGVSNLERLASASGLRTLVVAHHALRDLDWKTRLAPVFEAASRSGVRVETYAGLLGREDELLEARRRELYRLMPAEPKSLEEGGEE
jgi:Predicted hydrolase of the metallo-beta-lactamase superfamily